MTQMLKKQISSRMHGGNVFTPKDFLDLGSRDAVDQALTRLVRAGKARRLGCGLYRMPRINPRLGVAIPPDTDDLANAIARQTDSHVIPTGAVAANRLGLSTQVPAKPVYLTDGKTRTVRVGDTEIVMRHVSPKELLVGNRMSALVVQALRYLGKDGINQSVLDRLRRVLTTSARKQLVKDARYTTDWIAHAVQQIAAVDHDTAGRHG